jgi:hypothetical protein
VQECHGAATVVDGKLVHRLKGERPGVETLEALAGMLNV